MPDPAALTREKLVATLRDSRKPLRDWLGGAEFERHLLLDDGRPLPYAGPSGVASLLGAFAARGWSPVREGEHTIALHRGRASITLEPGGQFELSGTAGRTLADVEREARQFALDVDALAGSEVHQVALGFTPYAPIDSIGWVPKGRYAVMREYLHHTGALAHHMMKGTCAVQATFDYADEADCARKVRLATLLGPLTTAIYANSPWAEGRPTGFMSWRGHIWTRTDPARTGFPAAADAFTFDAWVDWLLQVPMMFTRDAQGRWQAAHGRTFAAWMAEADAHGPELRDWELHLTSVFPEVRVKKAIEVRGADCVPLPLGMSFVALFTGLLYDERALGLATEHAERFAAHGTKAERFDEACRRGLEGVVGKRRLAEWAAELVGVAEQGLERWEPGGRRWLAPLRELVAHGESPARLLLRKLGETPDPGRLLTMCHVLGTGL